MKEKKEKYCFPEIGEWLRETITMTNWTNERLINDTEIRRESFYKLLKGGM